jgi:prophage regulatory protein
MANETQLKPTLPDTGYVRLPQVLRVFPVSRSSWYAGIKEGRYPEGILLGPRTRAWRVEDIRKLIEAFNGGAA